MVSKVVYKKSTKANTLGDGFFSTKVLLTGNRLCVFLQSIIEFMNVRNDIIFAISSSLHYLNEKQKMVFASIIDDLMKGISFHISLSNNHIFPQYAADIIKCGEKNSNLLNCVKILQNIVASDIEQKKRMKKALFYPVFSLLVLFIVICLFSCFIIPSICDALVSMDPNMENHFYLFNSIILGIEIISILILLFISFMVACFYFNKTVFDIVIYHIPFCGKFYLYYKIFINSFYMNNSLLNGASINESIDFLVDMNDGYSKKILVNIKNKINKGEKFYKAIEECKFAPNLLFNILKTGEESCNLQNSFSILKSIFLEKYKNMFDKIVDIFPIVIILFNAAFIMLFVLFVFMPIYSANIC